MKLFQLKEEIKSLRECLYKIGNETNNYSQGEILKVSQELDQKLLSYQKLLLKSDE